MRIGSGEKNGEGERRQLPQRGSGLSPGRQHIFGIFDCPQNTSGRENNVTLLNDASDSPESDMFMKECVFVNML